MTNEQNKYWIAGLLEGEGYFGLRRKGDLIVQIGMTDADVIERARFVLGVGKIKVRALPSGKTCYTLTIAQQDEAERVMRDVLPLMGARRAAKIEHCLAERAKVPAHRRHWTHCSHGHPLAGDNLQIVTEGKYAKRRCRECGRQRQQKHRAKLAA